MISRTTHPNYDQEGETLMDVSEIAGEAYKRFETATRPDSDERYTRLKDDSPEWLMELVREAHGDMLPDDYRYEWAREALGAIHDSGAESIDDLDDLDHEFADGVDVYTSQLTEWLGSHSNRMGYCDEAASEGLIEPDADMFKRMSIGQYMERREVFGSVVESLRERVDELEAVET